MDKLPERDDLIYKEIEEFQDYELTNCIAYEMAIRNNQINMLIKNWRKKERIFFKYCEEYYKTNEINLNEVKISLDLEKITNDLINFGFSEKNIFSLNIDKIGKNMENLHIIMIYPKSFMTEKDKPIYKNPKTREEFKENAEAENKNLGYGKFDENLNLSFPIIETYIKRPKFSFRNMKKPLIDINLNLPKEELIAYISKIKDEYDKDNSIIKTPLELLGETLEKSDKKKTPKKPKASVYADWFYIYDYWKYDKALGKTDKDIFIALEVENDVPYKEDMLRKIRDKMKYFIDDLGYKELITGVKNT